MKLNLLLQSKLMWALLALLLGSACTPGDLRRISSLPGTLVWLDQPPDGATIPVGNFTLKAHARDTAGGVSQISFLVNDTPIGNVATDPSADLAYAEMNWNASVPGEYILMAVATNANGAQARSGIVRVCVGASCTDARAPTRPSQASPTPAPSPQAAGCTGTPVIASFTASPASIAPGGSATLSWSVSNADIIQITEIGDVAAIGTRSVSPSSTTTYVLAAFCKGKENFAERSVTVTVGGAPTRTLPVQPTATRTRTPTPVPAQPTATRTHTPVPQTGCNGTPNIASFSGSPTTINAGGSATLSWGAVTNADSVEINPGIGGVGTPGSTSVSPGATTTYTLLARCGQNTATRTVTINVTQQDTTPPSIANVSGSPNPVFHSNGCGNTTLTFTANVSDPSGVSSVTVNYQYKDTKGNPFSSPLSKTMNPTGGNNYSVSTNVASEASQFGFNNQAFARVDFSVSARDNPGNTGSSGTVIVQTQLCIP
jgi:hypothetical protein